jgi:hypothetical protein
MGGGFGFGAGDGGRNTSIFGFVGKRFNYSAGWTEETRDTLAKELESRGITLDDTDLQRRNRRIRALALVIALGALAVIVFAWSLALWRSG